MNFGIQGEIFKQSRHATLTDLLTINVKLVLNKKLKGHHEKTRPKQRHRDESRLAGHSLARRQPQPKTPLALLVSVGISDSPFTGFGCLTFPLGPLVDTSPPCAR